jgi:F0F1-type ATP synthase assembly protein I
MGAAFRPREGVFAVPGSVRGKQLRQFVRVGAIGIELALSTVIGILGGRWLDSKLSTAPWLTILGLILGVVAGFRSLIRAARQNARETDSPPSSSSSPDDPDD